MEPGLTPLLAPWRRVEVEQRLAAALGGPVLVTLTTGCFVAVLPAPGVAHVRVDPAFLYAPEAVLDALARHARWPLDLQAHAVLEAFRRADQGELEADRAHFHDLEAIRDEL